MPSNESRRRDLENYLRNGASSNGARPSADGSTKRWALETALSWAYAAIDAQYARLRSFRNVIIAMSVALLVLAIGLAMLGMYWPQTLQLCFVPNDVPVCPTGSAPSSVDAFVIEVLGATGGALSAVLAVRKIQGTSTPYGVPLALALLKLPLGALSALAGLLLVHGQFIPGLTDLDTSGQIIAYALFLGAAQQALTAFVDRRGQELLDRVPDKRGYPPSDESRRRPPADR